MQRFIDSLSVLFLAMCSSLVQEPEPPLQLGKFRLRWTCQCGETLWDDFKEMRPGAAEEMQSSLVTSKVDFDDFVQSRTNKTKSNWGDLIGRQRPRRSPIRGTVTGASTRKSQVTEPKRSTNEPTLSPEADSSQCHNKTNTQRLDFAEIGTASSIGSLARTRSSLNQDDSATDGLTTASYEEKTAKNSRNSSKEYLLLCLGKRSDTLRLHQLDIGNISNDVELCELLRKTYRAHRGRLSCYFFPRKIVSVKFRKVIETTPKPNMTKFSPT